MSFFYIFVLCFFFFSFLFVFFLQAEDGIRDLVRSRGLGDVYKRQRYFYSDFCSGELRMLTPDGDQGFVDALGASTGVQGISSFGESATGELFVTNLLDAKLFKVADLCPMDPPEVSLSGGVLHASAGAVSYTHLTLPTSDLV